MPLSHASRPLLQVSCAASVLRRYFTVLLRKKASVRAPDRAPDSKQRSSENKQPYKCGALVKERRQALV